MTADEVVQRDRPAAAFAQIVEAVFGEIEVFQIIEVIEDRLARVEALRATGSLGEFGETGLDFRRKRRASMDGPGGDSRLYMYSFWRFPATQEAIARRCALQIRATMRYWSRRRLAALDCRALGRTHANSRSERRNLPFTINSRPRRLSQHRPNSAEKWSSPPSPSLVRDQIAAPRGIANVWRPLCRSFAPLLSSAPLFLRRPDSPAQPQASLPRPMFLPSACRMVQSSKSATQAMSRRGSASATSRSFRRASSRSAPIALRHA